MHCCPIFLFFFASDGSRTATDRSRLGMLKMDAPNDRPFHSPMPSNSIHCYLISKILNEQFNEYSSKAATVECCDRHAVAKVYLIPMTDLCQNWCPSILTQIHQVVVDTSHVHFIEERSLLQRKSIDRWKLPRCTWSATPSYEFWRINSRTKFQTFW